MARKHRRPNPHAIAAKQPDHDSSTATAVLDGDRPVDAHRPVDADRRDMEQGERTKPSQPEGTAPLDRVAWPMNQKR